MHRKTSYAPVVRYPAGLLTAVMALLLIIFVAACPVPAQTEPLIKMIEITGNRKISTDTIISKITSTEGLPFSKAAVQEDIRKIYSIGYFEDITVEIDSFEGGVRLIYTVREKPSIVSIDFQGNKKFEASELREKITLTAGAVANPALITDNGKKLLSFYQSEGYWLAEVVPLVREVSPESAAVTFQITEGKKVKVSKVTIEGNRAVSKGDILDVMKTRKWWIFSFLTGSGVYREEDMRDDIARIKALYQSKGYLYIAVSEPAVTLSPDKKKLTVSLSVSEGDQYSVGSLKIRDNTVISTEELMEGVETAPGKVFNRTALRNDIDRIIDRYMDRGYARADVNPVVDVNRDNLTADITLAVSEGSLYRIGRINIKDNIKTRDKVIRREVRLDEGDIYNRSLLKRSYQRINNLNYFDTVDIQSTPRADEELMDVDIKVKEKMTGMLSLGGGYSSTDKFMIMGELTQTNLFGRGLQLKLKADFSSRRTNYNLSLRDPWFMDKPISAAVGIYNEEVDYDDYDKKATGGFVAFGKELSEYVGGNIKYTLEEVEITEVSEDASSLIKDQVGSSLTSSISPSIWRDTRDEYIDPTEGSRNALYLTLAGLGGDNYFYKGVVDSMWYFPVIWGTTFSVRGRYGYAEGFNGEELPLYERFYVGGINTIRGLGWGEGGPRNEEGEKIGGTEELIFNFEYIFPIVKEIKLKGVLFFDYGGAFDSKEGLDFSLDNMRQTAGAGLRWLSPFGPIRIEWGYNLDPKDDEGSDKLEFSMGGFF
ncbi:MAG: outer membrane protein assembly factor BamA [Nitrospiraceae bacterium]|nr:MAG: outer membrane protein assembly factor BamA [Nitrospiraceae bacterium]